MNRQLIGHLASFGAYAIFGLNIVFCKDIANQGELSPIFLFTLRALCAGILFWLLGLFTRREKVPPIDLLRMAGAALLGLVIPQMTFLTAITMTAPIALSVVQSMTPIMTMFVAAIFLKEPITWKKAGGVALSFAGVLWLIFQSTHAAGPVQTRPLGIILTITNALCFALYLGICRPVIQRYSVVTLMKWMFLFAFLGLLDCICHICRLFPYSNRSATHSSNFGEHVWLSSAYHSVGSGHSHWYGPPHMDETFGGNLCLCWGRRRQPQPSTNAINLLLNHVSSNPSKLE